MTNKNFFLNNFVSVPPVKIVSAPRDFPGERLTGSALGVGPPTSGEGYVFRFDWSFYKSLSINEIHPTFFTPFVCTHEKWYTVE